MKPQIGTQIVFWYLTVLRPILPASVNKFGRSHAQKMLKEFLIVIEEAKSPSGILSKIFMDGEKIGEKFFEY